jgi:hypothetical protein
MTLFPLLLKEKLREREWQPSVLAENGEEPGRYQEPKQIVDGF